MMTDTQGASGKRAPGWKKLLGQASVGFLVGAAGAYFMMMALDDARLGFIEDGSRVFAMLTALVYALTAAAVLIGVASPKVGAATLDVEDEDELREERQGLAVSGSGMLMFAAFLAALALGGGTQPVIDPTLAAWVAGVSIVIAIGLNVWAYRLCDELIMAMTGDATMLCSTALLIVFGGWAALANFGQAAMFEPLDFLAGFFAIYLLSVFIVAGKRGMLKPR